MAVARAEGIINADLLAAEVNLESLGLDSLEPVLPLLANMPRLKALKLAHNKLTGLPCDLSSIRQLEYLDISANPITGLSTIVRGLYSLVILRHLYVDLPFENEEDEVIVSLHSLQSFNGTSLTGVIEDEEIHKGNNRSDPTPSLQSFLKDAKDTSMGCEILTSPPPQQRHHQQKPPNPQEWSNEDTVYTQELHALVVDATGNISNRKEFNGYLVNVVQHLGALTATETDAASREGETLKAKKLLYEYCLEELCRAAGRKDIALGRAFTALIKAQTALLERYDRLWRGIAEEKSERIAVMKKDMQDAIHEIESLMSQVGQPSSRSGCAGLDEEAELQRLQEEVGRLRTENERLQTKLRLTDVTGCSPNLASASAARDTSVFADRTRVSPSRSQTPQFGNKVLTLRQLKSTIEDIYVSKSKYDIKCSESHLPRETMEQHMYTYLNQRYGLKHIILDWATAIVHGIKKYAPEDNDVAVFGRILRNEIDEEFRFVQRQVRETVHELLRVYVKGKRPSNSDAEINKIVQKKVSGTLLEDEWVDIVKYMYNTEDAVAIIMRLRDHLRQLSQPRRRRSIQGGQEPTATDAVQLPYTDLIRILLDFQLEGHERFLAHFLTIFRRHDADRNGIVNAQEFAAIVKSVDPAKTDGEINAVLELIDPFGNQLVTYSECVTFLSTEIVKMRNVERRS
ncbi:putative structural maintenance of chromosome (SMC) family protein [Trypanosoma grayi]|uniref:putative structural maintenance of chromosome (SMC) family protein n=1 Tax=Trypanosoma grayi TaxID=71804 RepID=UPI0004F3F02E|nr:putative structural maintenance of chromosome (SMC) family protein [Trypanosoma grayi]KEG13207.1 putative structural maintenance of chromosome (SMC) family protein [Trypanosoma grayi]